MYEAYVYGASSGGLLFESFPRDLNQAFVIAPGGLTGVYDAVDTKGESVARPATHGSFDLPVFRGERFPVIKGTAIARSEFDLVKMGEQLRGVLADGADGTLVVRDPSGSRWATVRLSGAPKFEPHSSGLEADFQIGFKAVDPRMYGETHSFTGATVEAVNRGNFPASPVVEVVGPRSAYMITGPGGRQIVVTQSLTAGQTHRLDFADGGLYRDGVRQLGAVSVFRPWTIPAARSVPMGISSGEMTVHVTDTYM